MRIYLSYKMQGDPIMEKEHIERCFYCWCYPYRTNWENPLSMTIEWRVWSLLSVENCLGHNPRTLPNTGSKSDAASDFTLAGFQKRGFFTKNIHFQLIEINWCGSTLALFKIIEQSWFVAIHLEAGRHVLFDNTIYMGIRLRWCVWRSAFENVLQHYPQEIRVSIGRHKT